MWSGDLPSGKWGGWGSGDHLLLLCKEVSVLQQDCVYIESYIMAQLYAKLLLKFSFLWESVVQALLISVYCCSLWQIKSVILEFFFVLNSPIPTPHLLTLRKCVTCRVGLWNTSAFETPHQSKAKGAEHHSPLLSVLALSQQQQVTAFLFSLYLTKFL
jgi:hypothetical protein